MAVSTPTAIYSPPVRLGGRGSMIFLPQSNRTSDDTLSDEAAAIGTLHAFLDPKGEAGCLNPVLEASEFDAEYRKYSSNELQEEISRKPSRNEVYEHLVSEERGSWGTVDGKNESLVAPLESEIAKGFANLVMTAPRQRGVRTLKPNDLPNILLKADCTARLGRPAIHDGWAFVSMSTVSAGHLYALRRSPSGWTVVGRRFTYII